MSQDTGKFRKNTKDQYYTKEVIAIKCITEIQSHVPHSNTLQWIEPSAGNGVFLKNVPSSIDILGIDIEPKHERIQKANYLEWNPPTEKEYLIFGNPPFGRQGSLAKEFIRHSSRFANTIAFILPRSFIKPSMSRVFPPLFHCIYTSDIPKNAFEVNGEEYDVPCVFQIWIKKDIERLKDESILEDGFEYVRSDGEYDIAIRRVGFLAGKSYMVGTAVFSTQSHYFLKFDDIYADNMIYILEEINEHVFPSNTVGPRSLSKSEVNEVINNIVKKYV